MSNEQKKYKLGNRMANTEHATFSTKLYDYLCEVIGSDRTVHARRIFFKVIDNIFVHKKNKATPMITSGSKSEGLDMTGSDIDIMIVYNDVSVFHDISEVNNTAALITNFDYSPPGFVLLTVVSAHKNASFFTFTEHGAVLSSKHFKDFLLRFHKRPHADFVFIHGPCLSTKIVDIDLAACFRSATWPKIAQKWFQRPKNPKWPPSYVISKMADAGLLYVPIGSKFGSGESNPLEWRISFSIQEKLLIYSFSHTQLLCYAMLKIVLKEIIDKEKDAEQLLCSYFMKTVIFWISEECSITKWRPEALFSCFQSCLQRLLYWVQLGYCPNYFIPEHNMFEGKIYGKSQKALMSCLEGLLSLGPNIIFKSATLAKLNAKQVRSFSQNEDIDRAIYPLLHIYFKFVSLEIQPCQYLPLLITMINKASKNGLDKSLYLHWLAYFSIQLLIEIPYITNCSNKSFYKQYTTCQFYCLLGKNIDVVSGWLWVAAFFYQHGEFLKALTISDRVLERCTPDKLLITDSDPVILNQRVESSPMISFLKRHKLSCIYQLHHVPRLYSVFYNSDLSTSAFEQGIVAPPVVFIHFVRALCYHRLGNVYESNQSLKDIESCIEEDCFIGSSELRMYAYMIMLRAFQLTNNTRRAAEILDKALLESYKQPELADIYVADFSN